MELALTMARHVWELALCFYVALNICTSVAGSKISLAASRPSIQPPLTPILTLRCTLDDTAASTPVVGRSVSSTGSNISSQNNNRDGTVNSTAPDNAPRSVFSTPYNAKFVTSMFLFLNNEDVASLSEHVPARALVGDQNLNVSGEIPGKGGEQGVLEVNITYPTDAQGGNYSCRVTAIDDVGHSVTYSTFVDVEVTTPTMNDLVHIIHKLQLEENTAHMAKITTNEAEITTLKTDIERLNQQEIANKNEISALKSSLDIATHIESGTIHCARLGFGAPNSITHSVTYSKPYNKVPMVHLALMDFGAERDHHPDFHVRMVRTDRNGFTVECRVDNVNYYIEYLDLPWLSFPIV